MAWPSDRLTTYAPRSQLKSADLNAIQDGIRFQHHALITMTIPATSGQPERSGMQWQRVQAGITFSVLERWYIPIDLLTGSRIVNVRCYIKDYVDPNVGVIVRCGLFRGSLADGSAAVLASAGSAGNGTNQTLSLNAVNESVLSSRSYYVTAGPVNAAGFTIHVYGLEVDFDHPAQ